MKILGIDPGLVKTGFGVVKIVKEKKQVVDYGIIKPNSKTTLSKRLYTIYKDTKHIIEMHTPTVLSIEDIFYGKNIKSAILLGQARGSVLVAAAEFNLSVYEYSPRKIKQSIAGNGNAHKEQVKYMVEKILNVTLSKNQLDASDALAIALCYEQQFRSGDL